MVWRFRHVFPLPFWRGSECHVYGVFVVRFHFGDLLRHSLRTSFWLGAWWSWWFIHMVNHCWFIDMIWYGLIVVNYCLFLHFIACYYVNSLEICWILCLIFQSKLLLDHHQTLDMEKKPLVIGSSLTIIMVIPYSNSLFLDFFFPWLRLWRRPDGYEQLLTLRIQAGDGPKRSVPAGEGEVVK